MDNLERQRMERHNGNRVIADIIKNIPCDSWRIIRQIDVRIYAQECTADKKMDTAEFVC